MKKVFLFSSLFLLSTSLTSYCWAMDKGETQEEFWAYGGAQGNFVFQQKSKEAIEYVREETKQHIDRIREIRDVEKFKSRTEKQWKPFCKDREQFSQTVQTAVEAHQKNLPSLERESRETFVFTLEGNLIQKRADIAEETNTEDSAAFARVRSVISITAMEDKMYREWRDLTARSLKEKLEPFINKEIIQTERVKDEECSYEISICKGTPVTDAPELTTLLAMTKNTLSQQNPNLEYMTIVLKMYINMGSVSTLPAETATTKVYALIPYDINSPNGLTLDSLNLLVADSSKENLDEKKTILITQHPLPTHINNLDLYAASFLPQITEWTADQDIRKLHAGLGNFAFPLIHAMKTSRGTAARVEWEILGFAAYHGFTIKNLKGFDQWALQEPSRNKFLQEFMTRTYLEKL